MPPRLRFALSAVAWSAVLFAAATYADFRVQGVPWNSVGMLVPVIGVMLAAEGVSWARRLATVGWTVCGFVVLHALVWAAGIQALAESVLDPAVETYPRLAVAAGYYLLSAGYPLVALLLFVGRDPGLLWVPREDPRPAPQ